MREPTPNMEKIARFPGGEKCVKSYHISVCHGFLVPSLLSIVFISPLFPSVVSCCFQQVLRHLVRGWPFNVLGQTVHAHVLLPWQPMFLFCWWGCFFALFGLSCRWQPYRVESTRSLPTSEVKQPRVWLVLWWGAAWEDQGAASFCPHVFALPESPASNKYPVAGNWTRVFRVTGGNTNHYLLLDVFLLHGWFGFGKETGILGDLQSRKCAINNLRTKIRGRGVRV